MNVRFENSPSSHPPHKPTFVFIDEEDKTKYWMLGELYMCDRDYILNEVLPNLEKILRGELVQDPTRQDENLVDFYEFGYDATIIDFYKDKSTINYGYWEGKIEVSSTELYSLMQEWAYHLKQWNNSKSK